MSDSTEKSQLPIKPAKLIFFFAGTGDIASNYQDSTEYKYPFEDNVIRVYVSGCQHPQVGNGVISPNLEIIANHIYQSFEGKSFNTLKLQEKLGDGVCVIQNREYIDKKFIPIESIALEGFSRGAVTTFAVAKKIDLLDIPIDIIANQPVSGETSEGSHLYHQYHDLSHCNNINSATTILATHDLRNGSLHDVFFKQMIAKLPCGAKNRQFLVPAQSHLQSFKYPIVAYHIGLCFMSLGLQKKTDGWMSIENVALRIKAYYSSMYITKDKKEFITFTPKPFMQGILGAANTEIPKDPLYLKMLSDQACKILSGNSIDQGTSGLYEFNDAQAQAIVVVEKLGLGEAKNKLYQFIYDNSYKAQQFMDIINFAHEMTEYLYARTLDDESETLKSENIRENSQTYLQAIAIHSYEFLKLTPSTDEQKKIFISAIVKAEIQFRKNALSISRVVDFKNFPIISKFIASITKLINYFTKTYSEHLIIKTSEQLAAASGIENFKKLKSAIREKTSQREEMNSPKSRSK